MRFIVLGTSKFTQKCTQVLLEAGVEVAALISLPQKERQLDSIDLKAFAEKHRISYYEFSDLSSVEANKTMSGFKPDYIFSSWPHLLKADTIGIPKHFVIGSHPGALPYNRGRHPLYWLFCLGFHETKISFFIVDEKVDNGPILSQIPFSIPQDADVSKAFENMGRAACLGMIEVIQKLRDSTFRPEPQDSAKANYWRKRTPHDVILDPRMSGQMIVRTVRSYAPPYPGAILLWKDSVLRVKQASVDSLDYTRDEVQRMENGRICHQSESSLFMKSEDSLVKLDFTQPLPAELASAKHIHPPTYYLSQGINIRIA
jgi:methionyl-tRNA formyltransferase